MAILKEITTVASVKMPIGENWTVSRCRYSSENAGGKRLCLATGIHGDEWMGQLVVCGVAQRIKREEQHLTGTVDIYPMLNPIGLDIGERMVPSGTRLDMNRAFPGAQNGTALESICWHVLEDMKGADLVLDIHASSQINSQMYSVYLHERSAGSMLEQVCSLQPEMIWVLEDRPANNAMLTGSLTTLGTPAMILEMDGRRLGTQAVADHVIGGIFCKMKEMGMWTGETVSPRPLEQIPCMHGQKDICRVSCTHPGMYVPVERMGGEVKEGDVLGTIIDALEGETVETVLAPESGLVFTQRRYSTVYPGTPIARLCRKERA